MLEREVAGRKGGGLERREQGEMLSVAVIGIFINSVSYYVSFEMFALG
jgi:hypothetical protein